MKSAGSPNDDRKPVPPRPPRSMRDAVLLSLIVCPKGGVPAHRHGQGAIRP
jgi:hypothetical protein